MRNKSKKVNLLPEPALLRLRATSLHPPIAQSQHPYF